MRIAVAGFMHESNTFNPLKTDRAAFQAQSLTFGPAMLEEWRDAHHEVGGFIEAVKAQNNELLPLMMGWATPSGPVTDDGDHGTSVQRTIRPMRQLLMFASGEDDRSS